MFSVFVLGKRYTAAEGGVWQQHRPPRGLVDSDEGAMAHAVYRRCLGGDAYDGDDEDDSDGGDGDVRQGESKGGNQHGGRAGRGRGGGGRAGGEFYPTHLIQAL